MTDYFITMAIAVILQTVKNPDSKRKFKSAFLKVRNAINAAFAGDEDFQK